MPPRTLAFTLALAILGALAALGWQAWMQTGLAPGTLLPAGAEAAVASPNNARTPLAVKAAEAETGPGWETLDTPQKLALYPLAERWALISEAQKRRWLALAATFPSLPEEEQAKFHDRIIDWASLSAQQRSQARLNYATAARLAPDDRRAQWEAYQALPDEEKRALAARAAPRPKGAATALRPVPPKKLARVPAATQASPQRANPPKIAPKAPPVAASLPAPAPPLEPAPAHPGVETTPEAQAHALPPLEAAPPVITPDTSGLYPQ